PPAHPPEPSSRRGRSLPLVSCLAGAVRRKNHRSFRSMTMKKNGHANATGGRTTMTTEKNGHANATGGRATATVEKHGRATTAMKKNGHAKAAVGRTTAQAYANDRAGAVSSELRVVLSGLQAMRDGDFSVRLP